MTTVYFFKKHKNIIVTFIMVFLLSMSSATKAQNNSCETANTISVSKNIPIHTDTNYYKFTPSQDAVYVVKANFKQHSSLSGLIYTGSCNTPIHLSYLHGGDSVAFYLEVGRDYYFCWINELDESYTWEFSELDDSETLLCQTAKAVEPSDSIFANRRFDNWYTFTPNTDQEGLYRLYSDSMSVEFLTGVCNKLDGYPLIPPNTLFYAQPGIKYYFRWNNYYGGARVWSLVKETGILQNSLCQTAQEVTVSSDTITNDHSRSEMWWYAFTPTEDGIYLLNKIDTGTCWANIQIFTGNCNNLEDIFLHGLNSDNHIFYAEAGRTYYIRWLSSSIDCNYGWSLSKTNDTNGVFCETAKPVIPSTDVNISIKGNNWYIFEPTIDQEGTYDVQVKDEYMNIYVYKGECGSFKEEDKENYSISDGRFYAEAGETYHIRLTKYSDSKTTWSLTPLTDFQGLSCQTAIPSGADSIINTDFSKTNKNYSGYLWFCFTPTRTAYYTVSNDSLDRYVHLSLRIYNGDCNNLTPITITETLEERRKKTTFYAQAGTTYYIRWSGGFASNSPSFIVKWNIIEETQPEGLTCESAIITDTANNIKARNRIEWFRFTPQATGYYSANSDDGKVSILVLNNCALSDENIIIYNERTKIGNFSTYIWDKATFYAEKDKNYYIICLHDNSAQYSWNLLAENMPKYAIGVSLSQHALTMNVNDIKQLFLWIQGAYSHPTWISRDTTIATVSSNGKIIGKHSGITTIVFTAQAGDNVLVDSCLVSILSKRVAVKGVEVKHNTNIQVKGTEQLEASIFPSNATNKNISWKSCNENIATVDSAGIVTAITEGETYIVATTQDGGFQDSCLVTVSVLEIENIYNSETGLIIYPNPTTGKLTISIKNEEFKINTAINLYTLSGMLVRSFSTTGKKIEIDISHLPNGAYLLKIGNMVAKIIKE